MTSPSKSQLSSLEKAREGKSADRKNRLNDSLDSTKNPHGNKKDKFITYSKIFLSDTIQPKEMSGSRTNNKQHNTIQ